MQRFILAAAAALALLAAAPLAAAGLDPRNPRDLHILKQPAPFEREGALRRPDAIAPYRYTPPPASLSPLERQKAQSYQRQLQQQMLRLDRQQGFDPMTRRRLLETQNELDRMDDVLAP